MEKVLLAIFWGRKRGKEGQVHPNLFALTTDFILISTLIFQVLQNNTEGEIKVWED